MVDEKVQGGWYRGHDVQIAIYWSGRRCSARIVRIFRESEPDDWEEVTGWPADEQWADTLNDAVKATFASAKMWIDARERGRHSQAGCRKPTDKRHIDRIRQPDARQQDGQAPPARRTIRWTLPLRSPRPGDCDVNT